MKKLLTKFVFWINPSLFNNMSYAQLEKWGIADIIENKIIFENTWEYTQKYAPQTDSNTICDNNLCTNTTDAAVAQSPTAHTPN
jgi:hypothetical protein